MEYDKLTYRILNRLKEGTSPSAIQLGITSKEKNDKLFEMKDAGLIDYDLISKHPAFEGEPRTIILKPKGMEIAKNNDIGI
ncbi:hypothetical protein K9O30_07430 [Clostridium bowmanii]|uniref:hypothetical protein n=1 Tax=Clostridium bowmanii TaxID=132925 RepID=UPI001C0E16C1|nr:hypothetical protein [Clostridium bowmanii]MBU3189593.1 hypothetical protein [Clostridium bowmanii]MCA1073563.1 hypothetical protein [Clostridium bowmanii]